MMYRLIYLLITGFWLPGKCRHLYHILREDILHEKLGGVERDAIRFSCRCVNCGDVRGVKIGGYKDID